MASRNSSNKFFLLIVLVIILVIIAYVIQKSTKTELPILKGNCDTGLWDHVYHKYRLEVYEECKTVTGTIEKIRHEEDGDLHILLKLDTGQENLLNEKNLSGQHGDLVIEPICVNEVTQKDAIGSCSGYYNNVKIPRTGDHVKVTGSYVLDKEHGWNEIHPVTAIEGIN